MLPRPPCSVGGGVVYVGCSIPPRPPLVRSGLWVSGLVFILLPPSLWCGSGGLGFAPAPPWWCGWWGCLGFRCIDVNGFRVEGQQLAQTETVAHPGECRHFGHATKLHSFRFKSNTHEDPRFGGAIPVTVGTFETKVRPSRGFRVYTIGGGDTMGVGWGYRHVTRDHIYLVVLVVVVVVLILVLSLLSWSLNERMYAWYV